ncbi:L-glyceraldehyde 3-phosphate reductase [Streptomyces misionensis JCM 4497]
MPDSETEPLNPIRVLGWTCGSPRSRVDGSPDTVGTPLPTTRRTPDDPRRGPRWLRRHHALPAHRPLGARPAGPVPGLLAQLRRRPPVRDAARDRPARLRPRYHPSRPGEQLRPALRLRGGELRPADAGRPRPLPGRAGDLHQGGLGHVARPLRAGRGLAQVPAGLAGPVAAPDGRGLRRHLLLPPAGCEHAAGGDDGRPGHGRPPGQGALRRHLLLRRRAHPAGRGDPARPRHPAADPPAVVQHAQPLDRDGGPAGRGPGGGLRGHRFHGARPGPADRPVPGGRAAGLAGRAGHVVRPLLADRGHAAPAARPERDRGPAWADTGPAGARLGAARPAGDVPGHRRLPHRAAGAERGRPEQPGLHRRGAGGDRHVRHRRRRGPVARGPAGRPRLIAPDRRRTCDVHHRKM